MDTKLRHAIIERDGVEIRAVKKAQEKKLDVAEMRMLRWMSGVTKLDRIRSEVAWHVLRREEECVARVLW